MAAVQKAKLEAADGRVVGIEIKATVTPRTDDVRWPADSVPSGSISIDL
jgi:hypothetical protein